MASINKCIICDRFGETPYDGHFYCGTHIGIATKHKYFYEIKSKGKCRNCTDGTNGSFKLKQESPYFYCGNHSNEISSSIYRKELEKESKIEEKYKPKELIKENSLFDKIIGAAIVVTIIAGIVVGGKEIIKSIPKSIPIPK